MPELSGGIVPADEFVLEGGKDQPIKVWPSRLFLSLQRASLKDLSVCRIILFFALCGPAAPALKEALAQI